VNRGLFTSFTACFDVVMIEYYAARWEIESGLKKIKHEVTTLDYKIFP